MNLYAASIARHFDQEDQCTVDHTVITFRADSLERARETAIMVAADQWYNEYGEITVSVIEIKRDQRTED